MGEKTPATTTQNQSTATQTDPWSAATPLLQSMISKYGNVSTDPTAAQNAATTNLINSTTGLPNFAPQGGAAINGMFGNSGMINNAYGDLKNNLGGWASGANLNPYSTPGFSDALKTMNSDITNQVKGTYAAAGRDPSGAGSFGQSLGRGLSQGEGGLIQSQYNTNVGNMMNANNTLYNAGNTTAGAIDSNTMAALQAAGMLPSVASAPGMAQLGAANTAQSLPFMNLQQQLQAAGLLGGMGSSSTSTGTATGTQTPANDPLMNWIGGGSAALGLAGTLMSDPRAKEEIEEVGKLHDGQRVYKFRMKGDPRTQIGLMADEVEKKRPEAVVRDQHGMRHVNYRAATRFAGAGMGKAA
jgi:hypothetical protein